MAEKLDGLGNPIAGGTYYYVQDTAQDGTGDCCARWWANGYSYVHELGGAGVYLGDSLLSKLRPTDVAWPVDVVKGVAVQHVRVEALRKLERKGS